jgi:phosphoglycerate dehydrogenase-like enzyme
VGGCRRAPTHHAAKDDLLSRADVVSLHLVLSDAWRNRHRRPPDEAGAILVSARGPLVDEAALVAEVQSGRLIAALDVYAHEPVPADYPLNRAPDTVLTPHFGYSVTDVYAEYFRHAVENTLAFLDGKPIRVLDNFVIAIAPGRADESPARSAVAAVGAAGWTSRRP